MNEPLKFWSRTMLTLGALLLAIGLVPLLLAQAIGFEPLIPGLLALSVAPLGAIAFAIGLILFLAVLLRRRRGPS